MRHKRKKNNPEEFICPLNKVSSIEECRKVRTTVEYPNGMPEGTGLIEQINHPCVTKIHCFCIKALTDF